MAFESDISKLGAKLGVSQFDGNGLGGTESPSASSTHTHLNYNSDELRSMATYLRSHHDTGFVSNIKTILGNLPTVWQGPAANEFYTKVVDTVTKMQNMKTEEYMNMASKLENSASLLEQNANKIISGIKNF